MASDDNIFSNLNPKTLSSVTATDINTTTRDVHIERKNLDALKTTVLINEASMRDGGIIPGSGTCVETNQPNDSTYVDLRPEPGEVFSLQGVSVTMDNATGSNSFYFYLTDGTIQVYLGSNSSGSTNVAIFPGDSEFKFPVDLTRDMYLTVQSNLDAADACLWKFAYARKR